MEKIQITHYSDILCIWAYVSQIRCDELLDNFPEQAALHYRYFHVFGDVNRKLDRDWSSRGGLQGYAAHVQEIGKEFPHVDVHPEAWTKNPPESSMPTHLLLCAVRLLDETEQADDNTAAVLAWKIREAFFRDAADINNYGALLELAAEVGIDIDRIKQVLDTGKAHALLADDLEIARQQNVLSSPTIIFNEGRQRLTGNVGYRIIEANVRELLEQPEGQSSWC